MDQDYLSRPNLSPTGKTSIDANVEPDIQIVPTKEENGNNRAHKNVYYSNNLEWYRIGAYSNVNLCLLKETVEEKTGKNSCIMKSFTTFSILSYHLNITLSKIFLVIFVI